MLDREDATDDPNDPGHRDFDLSEAAGWRGYAPAPKPWFLRRWMLLVVAVLIIVALIVPMLP